MTSVTVKAVPWAFFVATLRFGTNSLIANTNLVTKIYLPRLVFPLAAVFSQLLDFLVASVVVGVLMVVAQAGLSVHLLWLPIVAALTIYGLRLGKAALLYQEHKHRAREGRLAK